MSKTSYQCRYSNRGGKRPDLGNQYFRSAWEANFARVLNHWGVKWQYEPKTFSFDGIKRGTTSYTPDFYLPELKEYVEVKGWMTQKSGTAIRRFRKYYPDERLVVIGRKEYSELRKLFRDKLPNWEGP